MHHYFQVLVASIWPLSGWNGKMYFIAKLTLFVKKFKIFISINQKVMTISKQQISLFTEEQSMCLPEDSRASHTATQGKDLEKRMTDTSGRKCLEQFEKFNRCTLWAKMFAGLLIGTGDWYSMKCRLIWKLKATKCSRFYFQLVPLTHPIDEIGFGLLPTARARDGEKGSDRKLTMKDGKLQNLDKKGTAYGMTLEQAVMQAKLLPTPTSHQQNTQFQQGGTCLQAHFNKIMLPTPTAMDSTGATATMKSTQIKEGSMHSMTLSRLLLSTPNARDWKSPKRVNSQTNYKMLNEQIHNMGLLPTPDAASGKTGYMGKNREGKQQNLETVIRNSDDGRVSQLLNPQFVAEMMGFPIDWTLLPFVKESLSVNGEMKA